MSKSERYTKKKNYSKKKNYTKKKTNKRTKKYGYTYKKKKTYKKRKQKGGIQCLTVNNTRAAVPPPPKENNITPKYEQPSDIGKYSSPVLSMHNIIPSFTGNPPKKVTETILPNIIVFWYDDRKKKLRDEFKKIMVRELVKNKKTHHWIWWVYPNICEITNKTPSKPNCELRNEADYIFLKKNTDYMAIREMIKEAINEKIADKTINTYKDWFTSSDDQTRLEKNGYDKDFTS